MSRANLLIVGVLTVGLAGMFFWTLSLSNRQSRLFSEDSVEGPGGSSSDHERRIRELERVTETQGLRVESIQGEIARTGQRIAGLETSLAEQKRALASLGGSPAAAAASGGAGETVLRETIEDVLAKKAEEERQQRMERMAQGMSRFLLADIEATDDQKARFAKVVASYLSDRDKIRREYSGEDADDELRAQAVERLDESRDAELQQIFGASDLAKIQERLDRGSRFMGGRGGRTPRTGASGGRTGGGRR